MDFWQDLTLGFSHRLLVISRQLSSYRASKDWLLIHDPFSSSVAFSDPTNLYSLMPQKLRDWPSLPRRYLACLAIHSLVFQLRIFPLSSLLHLLCHFTTTFDLSNLVRAFESGLRGSVARLVLMEAPVCVPKKPWRFSRFPHLHLQYFPYISFSSFLPHRRKSLNHFHAQTAVSFSL